MTRKSLILYASMTGNTEKVAMRFKEVFEKKGWGCDTLNVIKNAETTIPPVQLEDYDLLCVGSPILMGTVAKELFSDKVGILSPMLKEGPPETGEEKRSSTTPPDRCKKAIIFLTYTGDQRGPPETTPSFATMELRLEDAGLKTIGKFACPGKLMRRAALDAVATKFGLSTEDASRIVLRYKENPDHPEFAHLTEEKRAAITEAARHPMWLQPRVWHWDVQNRPHERDLLKAQIFLEEILEDYYQPTEADSISLYTCIS